MITIDNAFTTENRSVFEHFQRPGVGFYIPLYQREYSWDTDNIEQLLEDIAKGVESVVDENEKEIRFLGTIISVPETDKKKVQPQDTKALPPIIEKIIDGQQRLSSIALISSLFAYHLGLLQQKIEKALGKLKFENEEEIKGEIGLICSFWMDKLAEIYSVDLKRGEPKRKPKIIRGNKDKWVMEERENSSYLSPVSEYLYQMIGFFDGKNTLPKFTSDTNAGKNLNEANKWIKKTIFQSHNQSDGFPSALQILTKVNQEQIWQYDRPDLQGLIKDSEVDNANSLSSHLSSLVQLLALCHYLLDRCCFTIIQPIDDDWAFDMFQSLNATGTPLTAIETFKPLVVNTVEDIQKEVFKGSEEDKYFTKIEECFGNLKSAAQKSKLTNELLTSFRLPIEGKKLSSHFSTQRKWLEGLYSGPDLAGAADKKALIKFFGNYASFYHEVWNGNKGRDREIIQKIKKVPEADLVSMLVHYLIDANHKMAITFLGTFFSDVIEGTTKDSVAEFVELVKLLAGFYTIWRSSSSNSGLDDAYRAYFRGNAKEGIEGKNWLKDRSFDLPDIRRHFIEILKEKEIGTKDEWMKKSKSYLMSAKSSAVCRFALVVAAHDTCVDEDNPGLMKICKTGSAPHLNMNAWNSPDLKTLEHVAPRKGEDAWDPTLYVDEKYDSIGNLTLLPQKVNTSAGNKTWVEKYLYYQHISENDLEKIQALSNKARSESIILNEETLELLQNSSYASHVKHIVQLGEDGRWDAELVDRRGERILSILWDRVSSWVFP